MAERADFYDFESEIYDFETRIAVIYCHTDITDSTDFLEHNGVCCVLEIM